MSAISHDQFEVHRFADPLLPFILHVGIRLTADDPDFSNFHDGLEILYVTGGQGTLLTDGKRLDMTVGTVLTVSAGEVHRFETATEVQYHCLIVGSDFCRENGFDPGAQHYAPAVGDTQLTDLLNAAIAAFGEPQNAPYRTAAIRCAVLAVLAHLHRRYAAPHRHASAYGTDPVRIGLDYLHCHYTEPVTLTDIITHARISKYHFLRRFKERTGFTVVSYLHQLRCRRAAELLLNTDDRIAAVARACGFENPSYFTKTFTRIMGMRPAEYRAKGKNA